jgi:hypothetical protein
MTPRSFGPREMALAQTRSFAQRQRQGDAGKEEGGKEDETTANRSHSHGHA